MYRPRVENIEGIDYVLCKLCNWRGKQINTAHLKLIHNMKAKDYKELFPGIFMTCKSTRDKMSRGNSKFRKENPEAIKNQITRIKEAWKNPKIRQKYLNSFAKRSPQSDEVKKQISKTMKKVYANTNFPRRLKNENQFGEDNHFFGKTHTKESKKIISKKSTEWLKEAYRTGNKISPFSYLGKGKQMSSFEKAVNKFLENFGFVYDFPVSFGKGQYLIDFAHPELMLALELDSSLHNLVKDRDRRKDDFLKSYGWQVYRFSFDAKESPNILVNEIEIFINRLFYED